jgi:hypothetical protein
LFLAAAWPVNAANAQPYGGYGVGYQGVSVKLLALLTCSFSKPTSDSAYTLVGNVLSLLELYEIMLAGLDSKCA